MSGTFVNTEALPFCKGCGHSLVARNLETALAAIGGLDPLDVIVVSDIGCIGIIDKQLATHTVHGLHGRSVALATGIAFGIAAASDSERRKKIIVLLGDGGATIGLQHLLDAAHRNVDMTVIVHNNMLYGMTGGQPSSLTPCGYRTAIAPEGKADSGVDLCALVAAAGANQVTRLVASADMADELGRALRFEGFSFVEVLELCTSHGTKLNPGRTPKDIGIEAGLALGRLVDREGAERGAKGASPADPEPRSLFGAWPTVPVDPGFASRELPWAQTTPSGGAAGDSGGGKKRISLLLGGSAGEGVQTAAEILAKAAMSCGLHVSKKGSYPVTVGVGFSVAEVIISTEPIRFTGAGVPDFLVVTSTDGFEKTKSAVAAMKSGMICSDSEVELPAPTTGAERVVFPYRKKGGARNACLLAILDLALRTRFIPPEALEAAIAAGARGSKTEGATMRDLLKVE